MPNEELKQYIEKSRQAGKTDDQIRQELLSAGWQINLIDEALALFNIPAVVNGSVVKSIMDRREKISLIVLVISVPLVFIFSEKIPKLMALPVISGFTSFISLMFSLFFYKKKFIVQSKFESSKKGGVLSRVFVGIIVLATIFIGGYYIIVALFARYS